jgi:hypothetical protein
MVQLDSKHQELPGESQMNRIKSKVIIAVAAGFVAGLISFNVILPASAEQGGFAEGAAYGTPAQTVQSQVLQADRSLAAAISKLERTKSAVLVAHGYSENDLYQFDDHPALNEELAPAQAEVAKARAEVKRANELASVYGAANAAANAYYYYNAE